MNSIFKDYFGSFVIYEEIEPRIDYLDKNISSETIDVTKLYKKEIFTNQKRGIKFMILLIGFFSIIILLIIIYKYYLLV